MTALLLLCAIVLPAHATQSLGENPHGSPDACTACHEAAQEEGAATGPAKPVVATCLSCHPDADMHPVGIKAEVQQIPEGWPLESDLLTCATCHAEPAHEGYDGSPVPWFRGGPYPQVADLCYQCHDRGNFSQSDPHHPKTPRSAQDGTCAACHAGIPETGAKPADARLRFESNRVCVTCHVSTTHLGVRGHLGKEMDPEVAATLPDEVALLDLEITCWTCHEVHGNAAEPTRGSREPKLVQGLRTRVLDAEWKELEGELVWPGGGDPEHPRLLALSIGDGALCRACHGSGP